MTGASYRYPLDRTGRRRFASRRQYLIATLERQKGSGAGFTPQLCQAIEAVTDPGKSRHGDAWSRFSWLTVIVGSGCLDAGVSLSAERIAAAVGDAVEAALWEILPAGVVIGSEQLEHPTTLFTEDLVRGRIGREAGAALQSKDDTRGQPAPQPPEVEPLAVRLLVLASLLTRFFHSVRAPGHVASARWDDDEAVLQAGIDDTQIERHVVVPALFLMGHLQDELTESTDDADNVAEAVAGLLTRIRDGLSPSGAARRPHLKVDHLRLITEVAWYYLGRKNAIYPGWTELLLRLMLREGARATTTSGRPRPRHTQIAELPDAVAELIRPATVSSWRARVGAAARRDELYDAIADVLCAQADAIEAEAEKLRRDGRAANLPPAAAFVTSFDVELDMAMWRARGARPFSIAVPVHVIRSRAVRDAEFCWLLGTIVPAPEASVDQGLDLLCSPTKWRLLTPRTGTDVLRANPTVIHLSGCPLFELPSLADDSSDRLVKDLAAVGVVVDRRNGELSHAVTVDEYLALRQSEAELFWTSNSEGTGADRNRALHPSFTKDGDDNPRYWMSLGVPMADPAIRNRVASQITLRWIRDSAHGSTTRAVGEQYLGPDPAVRAAVVADTPDQPHAPPATYRADVDGVAINKRLSDDEVGLLNWLGLDVVDSGCSAFTGDLVHYAVHVRTEGERRPRLDRPCRLAGQEPAG